MTTPWPPTSHAHVEDHVTAAHGWATGSLLQRLRIGELFAPSGAVLYVTGRYYGSNILSTTVTLTTAASRLYLTPIYRPRPSNIDRLSINVSTAGAAGTVARVGIYNSNLDTGFPTTVLVDGGTLDTATTGIKEATVTATLHGLHWLAVVTSGTPVLAAYNASMIPNVAGSTTVTGGTTVAVTTDSVNAANPLPANPTIAYGATATPPLIMVRAAA